MPLPVSVFQHAVEPQGTAIMLVGSSRELVFADSADIANLRPFWRGSLCLSKFR